MNAVVAPRRTRTCSSCSVAGAAGVDGPSLIFARPRCAAASQVRNPEVLVACDARRTMCAAASDSISSAEFKVQATANFKRKGTPHCA
jgi:hypothetical protein